MELKWVEDLICVAEKGHFARAAEARHITQSALSRRVKSLEVWVGAELLDRSQHPIQLTPAGEEFMTIGREIVQRSYEGRAHAADLTRITETDVAIACLHTIALYHAPNIIAQLRNRVGPFETSIVAETRTIDEYLASLINGSSDFFICYIHPAVVFNIDEQHFPKLDIGVDRMAPYQLASNATENTLEKSRHQIPYLEYSGTSFMSRVVQDITKTAPFKSRLRTIYRASLAESLCTAALQGLGVAWLPESLIEHNPRADNLKRLGDNWASTLKISIFKSAANTRPIVNSIWKELAAADII